MRKDLVYGPLPKQEKEVTDLELVTAALKATTNMVAARDRRIAELEAALQMFVCPNCNNAGCYAVEHRDPDGQMAVENVQCECQALKPYSALDALLAQAKREILLEAAQSFSTDGDDRKHIDCDAVAAGLRRMAAEVKP